MNRPSLLVYGKIIIDTLRLDTGEVVTDLLGGGGPQGVLGARLFADAIGFLTRTGTDLDARHIRALQALDVDLAGWRQYAHLHTPRLSMSYDAEQNMLNEEGAPVPIVRWEGNWSELLAQVIDWPPSYTAAGAVHLITELPEEAMVEHALALREETGALVSLEPLIDIHHWSNLDAMMNLVSRVDIVCPDEISALHVAGVKDPAAAAQYWHACGPAHVAVRAGSLGSFLAGQGLDGTMHIPPISVRVLDPTGAGNAYAGALTASLLAGDTLPMAGCRATAAAAVVLEAVGLPVFSRSLVQRAHDLAARHYHHIQSEGHAAG